MARFKPLPSAEFLREHFIYNPETGSLAWRINVPRGPRAGSPAGCRHGSGYHVVAIGKSQYLAHRIIWKIATGEDPTETIDHRNGNPLDQRWTNLRPATLTEQNRNRGPVRKSKSGHTGVYWLRGKWMAAIIVNGYHYHLGVFSNIDDAIATRNEAAIKIHGEFFRE